MALQIGMRIKSKHPGSGIAVTKQIAGLILNQARFLGTNSRGNGSRTAFFLGMSRSRDIADRAASPSRTPKCDSSSEFSSRSKTVKAKDLSR